MPAEGARARKSLFNAKSLSDFENTFDPVRENSALQTRGEFIDAFPISRLKNLTPENYVIGLKTPTFCYRVEVQTRAWAVIQGATAFKFGIYFGRTKSDPKKIYRCSSKFGSTKTPTFKAVRFALIELVALGGRKRIDFAMIDANPLSQMFKAKILSLYFPDKFLNICSQKHLKKFATRIGFPDARYASKFQHLLMDAKMTDPITRKWSNPKFMEFLYAEYFPKHHSVGPAVRKPAKKRPGTVNFDDLQKAWSKIGKRSEAYALKWEKDRLKGAGLTDLVKNIDDRRNRPGYGYDFLSFTSRGVNRYIEVKTVAKVKSGGHRCFVSETEHDVSKSPKHSTEYFFYLVSLGNDGKPASVTAVRAAEQYKASELVPVAYEMRFVLGKS